MTQDAARLRLSAHLLTGFARDILTAAGLSGTDAATVSDCLVYADLRGVESHGVSRLPIYARRIADGNVNARPRPRVERGERRALRVIDGDNGPGAVVGRFAMEQAIAAAEDFGVGFALVRSSNHFGMGAWYAGMAAERNCLGICASNAPPTMAVWGAREVALGTNPIAIAAPAGRYGQINLDMSTSAVAKGKVLVYARKGEAIPEGWAIDIEGRPTTDAAAAMAGVMLPLGGAKGSGLGLIVDLISGVMSGAAFGDGVADQYSVFDRPQDVGHFFIAANIDDMLPLDAYQRRVEDFIGGLKAKRCADGVAEILMPGESKARIARDRNTRGVEIDPTLESQLDDLAGKFGQKRLRERQEG